MSAINLTEDIDKLAHTRTKLAFIYDSFSQSNGFEFSEWGGLSGVALLLEELIMELQEIEGNLTILAKERTPG